MIGMRLTLTITQMLVRITGVLQLILGLLIWFENAFNLITIHTYIGLVLVLSLWVLAAVSTQAGVPIGLAAGVALLGLVAVALGMTQATLLPGSAHWVIQVLHLLVGVGAIGQAEGLGSRIRQRFEASTTGEASTVS